MPDLTMEHRRTCRSNLRWSRQYPSSSGGEPHTVVFGPASRGQYSHDFECDCMGFRTRRKCRHVEQAKKDKCQWGLDAFAGGDPQPNQDNTCPECGGPTEVIRVGV